MGLRSSSRRSRPKEQGRRRGRISSSTPKGTWPSFAAWPDGSELISANDDETIRVWDVASGRILRTIRGEIGDGDPGKIYALALSRDGRLLAAGGRTGGAGQPQPIRLYDMNEGTLIGLLQDHDEAVLSRDFSPDGQRLVSGSTDDTAIIWDVASRKALHRLVGT